MGIKNYIIHSVKKEHYITEWGDIRLLIAIIVNAILVRKIQTILRCTIQSIIYFTA